MNKTIKLVGIIVLFAVIVFSMAGCWEQTCSACHGSGKCQSCKGSGVIYNAGSGSSGVCPNCYPTTTYPNASPITKGSGKCNECAGRGETKEGIWWK